MFNLRVTIAIGCLSLLFAACGKKAEIDPDLNSSNTPPPVTTTSSISCSLEMASNSTTNPTEVYVLLNSATSFDIVNLRYNLEHLEQIGVNENGGVTELHFEPKSNGRYRVWVTIADKADNTQQATCNTTFEFTNAQSSTGPFRASLRINDQMDFLVPAMANRSFATVSWDSPDASTCELRRDGNVVASGSNSGSIVTEIFINTGSSPMMIPFTLSCSNASNQTASAAAMVRVNPDPEVELRGAPWGQLPVDGGLTVPPGMPVNLVWRADYAESCTLNDGQVTRNVDADGTIFYRALSSTQISIECEDAEGALATDTFSINVPQSGVVLSANNHTGNYDKPEHADIVLRWQGQGIANCRLGTFGPPQLVAPTGTKTIKNKDLRPNSTALFRIDCDSPLGVVSSTVAIRIPAPSCVPSSRVLLSGNPFHTQEITAKMHAAGYIGVREVLRADAATASKVCSLFGYNKVVRSSCYAPNWRRCGFKSPGDNYNTIWNGSAFQVIGARPAGNQWLATLECARVCP